MFNDLRHALRHLRSSRAATLTVVTILATAMAVTLTAVGIVDSVLLEPLPFPDGERLVALYEANHDKGFPEMRISWPTFRTWTEESTSFEALAAYIETSPLTLGGEGQGAVRLETRFVTEDYLSILGARARAGRVFTADEHWPPMGERVVLISEALWKSRFGGRDDVVGAEMSLNDERFTVVGVIDGSFHDLSSAGRPTQLWVPFSLYPMIGYDWDTEIDRRLTRWLGVVARLAPESSLVRARAEMQEIAKTLEAEFPIEHEGYVTVVEPLRSNVLGDVRPAALALLAASLFVLVIGCANAASLLVVGAVRRRSETALQLALGMERGRLVRQLLIEGLLTAAAAAAIGFFMAMLAIEALQRFSPVPLPDYLELGLDPDTVWMVVALIAGVSVVAALFPARESLRVPLRETLQDGGRGGVQGTRGRKMLVAFEVAIAVVLVVGSALTLRSYDRLSRSRVGFDAEDLLAVRTDLPATRYESSEERAAIARELVERLEGTAGIGKAFLWSPVVPGQAQWYSTYAPRGRAVESLAEAVVSRFHLVSPGALEALGLRFVSGRGIEKSDRAETQPVVVVSESAAEALFPGEDPLGRQLYRWHSGTEPRFFTVVGVVSDSRQAGRAAIEAGTFDLYFPYQQVSTGEVVLLVRGAGDSARAAETVRATVAELDPNLPLYDVASLSERLRREEEQPRFTAFVIGVFAIIALFLAGFGLHGVVAYIVRQRTNEVGIRIALGGSPGVVVWELVREIGRMIVLGVIAGFVLSLLVGPALQSLLLGVDPLDPSSYLITTAVLALVALLGVALPLRRAARIDPVRALRAE